MKKNENELIDVHEGEIPVEERLMLLLAGIFSFPIGFALYFYFKNKNNSEEYVHFARIGAWAGVVFILLILISILMFALASCLQF